ncbi:MAG TPA: radical SAM protein [Thermoanaerobaculia bacterium]|nr:radical SAM protein [Thermoanaerobaculia bacterium]
MSASYPSEPSERDRWILARRGARNRLDASSACAGLHEEEPDGSGRTVPVSTIFLTNRECPWRCLMCDLWRDTLEESVPAGAIPSQIANALTGLPPARWIKLYNAGSFFDPRAIPPEDHDAIAETVRGFERVIVESHPALVAEPVLRFRDALAGSLEVAMGLETVHPEVLPKLNKRMTLEQFRSAARFLAGEGIGIRAFVLVGLPFVGAEEFADWACRSAEFAFESGASVVSLIPTRTGNGAMDALMRAGEFSPPGLAALEAAHASGLHLRRGRVLADLWDFSRLARCGSCARDREARLRRMNLSQTVLPPIPCADCGGSAS